MRPEAHQTNPLVRDPLRLRLRLRPSLRPSFRGRVGLKTPYLPVQRPLRGFRLSDIPTPPPHLNITAGRTVVLSFFSLLAPLALGACALASALASQRFSRKPRRRRPA